MPSAPRTKRTWRQSITSIALNNGESPERAQSLDSASPVPEEPFPNDSATSLILESDDPSLFLSFDQGDELNSIMPSSVNVSASLPGGLAPLPFYVLQLFLVTPSLLLGAASLQDAANAHGAGFSSIYMSILSCVAAAFLASLSSQIWVVAARYVRKWSIEEIIAQALLGAPGRRTGTREVWRKRVVTASRALLALLSAFICFIYLHGKFPSHFSYHAAAIIFRDAVNPNFVGHTVVVLLFAVVLTYFLLPTTMGSRRLWISMLITVMAHLASIIIMCLQSSHPTEDRRRDEPTPISALPIKFVNWEGLDALVFSFASPLLVLPLYISRLMPTSNSNITAPKRWRIPFPLHTLAANLISTLLLSPLVLISPHRAQPHPVLRSLALLFGIPPLWVLALSPRLPSPSSSSLMLGKYNKHVLWAFIVLLSVFIPPDPRVMAALRHVLVLCTLFTAYLLPGLLHIAVHMLRPPLAILFGADNEDAQGDSEQGRGHAPGTREDAALTGDTDALLRRKEQSLQRRRLGRRIAWDLGVWLILLPLGIAMTMWSGGRLFGRW